MDSWVGLVVDERSLPMWDEAVLALGAPRLMDTPTLIEWIQRQLESAEETAERLGLFQADHVQWHADHAGIYACCINVSWMGRVG